MTNVWRGSGCLVLAVLTACAGGGVEPPKTQFDTAPQHGSSDPSTDGGEVTGDEPSTSTTSSTSDTTGSDSPSDDSSTGESVSEDSTTGGSSDDSSTPEPVCGDGVAEGTEACDGSDLLGHGCSDFGFDGGTLACLADCSGFDESGCTVAPYCGDGVKDPAEQCDTADLGGQSCQSLGWDMGALACTANCTFDTSGCANAACTPIFGNCSQVPCCAGLFCLPINGHHCSPTP